MEKKKILITTVHMGIGGIESVLVNFLKSVDYKNYEVDLVLYKNLGLNLKKIPSEVKVYSPYSYAKKFAFLDRLTSGDSFLNKTVRKTTFNEKTLKFYISKNKYDIGIAFAGYHYVMDKFVGLSNCDKKYIWVHTDIKYLIKNDEKFSKNFYKTKNKYDHFDKIITVSNSVLKGLVSVFPSMKNKVNYIWNVLPTEVKNDKIKLSKKFNIVSVGRIESQKGYERLIDVVELLVKETKDFHVYILGDGSKKQELLQKLKDKGLENFIEFMGAQENVYKYLNSADLFLSTSYYEGFCTAIIEALLCKLPIVAPNVTGIVDIAEELAPKKSFILTDDNINSMAEGIKRAINGEINKNFNFSSEKFNKEIIAKYNKLLRGEL